MTIHPPRPSFALGVGVIGHRPNRLPEAAKKPVAAEASRILGLIADQATDVKSRHGNLFEGDEPVLTLVSALAEGADRIAAEAALKKGFNLDVPLPFSPEIYEVDFESAESRAAFYGLLHKARSVLTLPGRRADKIRTDGDKAAYEAAGLTVLAQADILLAIWDGEPSGGRGGTADMLHIAARSGLPIIHVDANGQHRTRLLWSGNKRAIPSSERLEDLPSRSFDEAFPALLDRLTSPPTDVQEMKGLVDFLGSRAPHFTWRLEFPLLMTIALVQLIRWTDFIPLPPSVLGNSFAKLEADVSSESLKTQTLLAQSYGWADAVAVRFSQTFRSAFVTNFVLAAAAVVMAVIPLLFDDPLDLQEMVRDKMPYVYFELICIVFVIFNTQMGHFRKWHNRWLEAREVAERLRAALPLWIVGLRPAAFVGAEPAWTGWYSRAILRSMGLRPGDLDEHGLFMARASLLNLLRVQSRYNEVTEMRMRRLNRRLELFGSVLFWATFGLATVFIIAVFGADRFYGRPIPLKLAFWLTAAAASLPVLATAAYGIRVIGDFEGVARRANRTKDLLASIQQTVERENTPDLRLLRALTREAADALLGDVANWRLVAESHGLSVPG